MKIFIVELIAQIAELKLHSFVLLSKINEM